MIEVELKLRVNEFPKIDEKYFVKEKRVLDEYYDTPDYKLISTGNFLRIRNNEKIDFKLNIGDDGHFYCKETNFKKDEFANKKSQIYAIFNSIGLDFAENYDDFASFLKVNNLKPLAIVDKYRRIFAVNDLNISLDETKDIGKFVEIECDLPDDKVFDADELRAKMLKKYEEISGTNKHEFVTIGYVEIYLKEHNKKAYELGKFKQ